MKAKVKQLRKNNSSFATDLYSTDSKLMVIYYRGGVTVGGKGQFGFFE